MKNRSALLCGVAMVLAACGAQEEAPLDPGSVGVERSALSVGLYSWWNLDETSGMTLHDPINGNNAMLHGGSVGQAGKVYQAVTLDGSTNYVDFSNGANPGILNFADSAPFTISLWVKTTDSYGMILSMRSSNNDNSLVDIAVGYDGVAQSAGQLMTIVRDDAGGGYAHVPGGYVNDNQWHRVTVTRNLTIVSLYLDGNLQGSASSSAAAGPITTDERRFGSDYRWASDPVLKTYDKLGGSIDEVRIYNHVLSTAELNALAISGSFASIQDSTCLSGPNWAVGGQYVDSGNGVSLDAWTMLARWQSADFVSNAVSYDLGQYTGYHPPIPYSSYQRGRQPESQSGMTPGVQESCNSFGMLVNTWHTPHRPIVGGGYNDMWGYAWSSANQVTPFVDATGAPTELVLQSNFAVGEFSQHNGHTSGAGNLGLVTFYAYLQDTAHPTDHPLCFLATISDSGCNHNANNVCIPPVGTTQFSPFVGVDYNTKMSTSAATLYGNWIPAGTNGNGVWFASEPLATGVGQNTSDILSVRYSPGVDTYVPNGTSNPNPTDQFYRVHISPANWTTLVNDINAAPPCQRSWGCPPHRYSNDPGNYKLLYAGVILEVAFSGDAEAGDGTYPNSADFDISPTSWVDNDSTKDQISMGVSGSGLSVYRYYP
jgi:hypothetical protein